MASIKSKLVDATKAVLQNMEDSNQYKRYWMIVVMKFCTLLHTTKVSGILSSIKTITWSAYDLKQAIAPVTHHLELNNWDPIYHMIRFQPQKSDQFIS